MNKNESLSVNQVVAKTAIKSIAVILLLCILSFSMAILISPFDTGVFLYKTGIKSLGAEIAYQGASNSDEFDELFTSTVMAVGANNNKISYAVTTKVLSNKKYSSSISSKDIEVKVGVEGQSMSAEQFVRFYNMKSGAALSNGETAKLVTLYTRARGWCGSSTYKSYTKTNPIRGIVSGIIENMKGDTFILEKLELIYSNTEKEDEKDLEWSTSSEYRKAVKMDAIRILTAFNYSKDSNEYILWNKR